MLVFFITVEVLLDVTLTYVYYYLLRHFFEESIIYMPKLILFEVNRSRIISKFHAV